MSWRFGHGRRGGSTYPFSTPSLRSSRPLRPNGKKRKSNKLSGGARRRRKAIKEREEFAVAPAAGLRKAASGGCLEDAADPGSDVSPWWEASAEEEEAAEEARAACAPEAWEEPREEAAPSASRIGLLAEARPRRENILNNNTLGRRARPPACPVRPAVVAKYSPSSSSSPSSLGVPSSPVSQDPNKRISLNDTNSKEGYCSTVDSQVHSNEDDLAAPRLSRKQKNDC